MAGLLVTSILSGAIISRTGRYRPFPIAGTAVMLSHIDGWAVGRQGSPFKPVILHWNGTRWTASRTSRCCELVALAARDAEDVWAVGYTSNGDGYQARVDQWNGHQWQTVPTLTGGSDTTLKAVSALPTGEILVAGTTTNPSGTNYPVLLRFLP